jgi:murein DD-endopeptidase MepM/ murein hydrolase activator NlpD
MHSFLRALALALVLAGPAGAAGGEVAIRFYPDHQIYSYELDAAHGWAGAMLQNAAVVNGSAAAVTLERGAIEIVAGADAVASVPLRPVDLERAAARGAAVAKAGLLQLYAFQFRPEVLLGPGVELAAKPRLAPGQALLFGQRFFSWSGAADRIRVRLSGHRDDGSAVEVMGELPIRGGGSRTEYTFPLSGRSYVGSGQSLHTSHRWAVPEEFALDLARLGASGSTHRGDGIRLADYYAYGQDVRAAADGTVVAAVDGVAEAEANLRQPGESAEAYFQRVLAGQTALLQKGPGAALGNYVVIEHAGGEFSHYAHLQPGSIHVHKGETVKRGQPLAHLGHSGNSTEPHLHFQVTDGPDPLLSAGIPIRFQNISILFADGPRAVQSGDVVEAP